MKKYAKKETLSYIFYGCTAGLYTSITIFSLIMLLAFQTDLNSRSLLTWYGINMLSGMILGALIALLLCYRGSKNSD